MKSETPDSIHGRLLESAHISGYSFGRACRNLEWLIDEDRWKTVGQGFEDINDFLATIDLSHFKIAIEQRKQLSKKLAAIEATEREAARLLGVSAATSHRDRLASNEAKTDPISSVNEEEDDLASNEAKTDPPPPTQSGEKAEEVAGKKAHRTQFTGEDEWYTPLEYIEAAREVMGDIDLDPATSEFGQNRIKAKKHYTIENNGLDEEWQGRVWLNPPYSQPNIDIFIKKISKEYKAGNVKEAIILTHNHTDTGWFHRAARSASKICFTKGRINYEGPTGEIAHPTQGAAFFYYGTKTEKFISIFQQFGFIR
ncbi:MAG TPA: hypothetical protein ENI06_01310 [Spirochaetales bacterium]|nr:hypothetical protein [Spirochaetales bacterium]